MGVTVDRMDCSGRNGQEEVVGTESLGRLSHLYSAACETHVGGGFERLSTRRVQGRAAKSRRDLLKSGSIQSYNEQCEPLKFGLQEG